MLDCRSLARCLDLDGVRQRCVRPVTVAITLSMLACQGEAVHDEQFDDWLRYSETTSESEVYLNVDLDMEYSIKRKFSNVIPRGVLKDAEFQSLRELMTDELFDIYEKESLSSDYVCKPNSDNPRVFSVTWLDDLGGNGGFGCWGELTDAPETRQMLETLSGLMQTLVEKD